MSQGTAAPNAGRSRAEELETEKASGELRPLGDAQADRHGDHHRHIEVDDTAQNRREAKRHAEGDARGGRSRDLDPGQQPEDPQAVGPGTWRGAAA